MLFMFPKRNMSRRKIYLFLYGMIRIVSFEFSWNTFFTSFICIFSFLEKTLDFDIQRETAYLFMHFLNVKMLNLLKAKKYTDQVT
jgi:hypothetical protein